MANYNLVNPIDDSGFVAAVKSIDTALNINQIGSRVGRVVREICRDCHVWRDTVKMNIVKGETKYAAPRDETVSIIGVYGVTIDEGEYVGNQQGLGEYLMESQVRKASGSDGDDIEVGDYVFKTTDRSNIVYKVKATKDNGQGVLLVLLENNTVPADTNSNIIKLENRKIPAVQDKRYQRRPTTFYFKGGNINFAPIPDKEYEVTLDCALSIASGSNMIPHRILKDYAEVIAAGIRYEYYRGQAKDVTDTTLASVYTINLAESMNEYKTLKKRLAMENKAQFIMEVYEPVYSG